MTRIDCIVNLLAPATVDRDILVIGLAEDRFPDAASVREAEPTDRLPIATYDMVILADCLLAAGDDLLDRCAVALREGGVIFAAASTPIERTCLTDSLIPAAATLDLRYRLSMQSGFWLLRLRK